MKKQLLIIVIFLIGHHCFSQQKDWSAVENVFGKKGMVQDNGFKIGFPRSDLKVNVGGFTVAPGFALGSWIGFMNMDKSKAMKGHTSEMMNGVSMMGDLVLLDSEVPMVLKKLVEVNLRITAFTITL